MSLELQFCSVGHLVPEVCSEAENYTGNSVPEILDLDDDKLRLQRLRHSSPVRQPEVTPEPKPDAMLMIAEALPLIAKNQNTATPTASKVMMRQSIAKDLPPFSGRAEEWYPFLASFKNTAKLGGYSDAETVERLRRCLRGTALNAVQSLLTSEDSLPSIMKILEMRFGNPEVIIRSMIQTVKAFPPVKEETHSDHAKTLIEFSTADQSRRDHCQPGEVE